MNVLVLGNGGREHALTWKIKQSPLVEKIFCIPGNTGTADIAENVELDLADFKGLIKFAKDNKIELTVVGPEAPLVKGIVDAFTEAGLRAFGPSKRAARLEGSKIYMKKLMRKHSIPTADYVEFNDAETALAHIRYADAPYVIKADGLASGKGVYVIKKDEEAAKAIQEIMVDKQFGASGNSILIEDFMPGEEASLFVFTDGKNIYPLESAQDHKTIFDNDEGPNTGGMGAYSPAPVLSDSMLDHVIEAIIVPTIHALNMDDSPYKGLLYAGLMITQKGPKVVEFNCRFGDPETQAVLLRMKSDIVPILIACCDGTLGKQTIEWDKRPSVCVVMSSQGYPGDYTKNKVISGLDKKLKDCVVFHSGVRKVGEQYLTNGGRVLGVTALGNDLKNAMENCYRSVEEIGYEGAYYRKDIGKKGLGR
jgi:phosphoribosylamine--glycine ligase